LKNLAVLTTAYAPHLLAVNSLQVFYNGKLQLFDEFLLRLNGILYMLALPGLLLSSANVPCLTEWRKERLIAGPWNPLLATPVFQACLTGNLENALVTCHTLTSRLWLRFQMYSFAFAKLQYRAQHLLDL
jgi:hypothetical protein